MTIRLPLRVLLVEDADADAELLERSLARSYDVHIERVQNVADMQASLGRGTFDVIVSDYTLPRFSALEALALVRGLHVDVPFIVVSGTVGEDVAVEAMRAGAHDFLLKDRLQRLVPAIERELRDAGVRREGARTRQQLVISDRMASIGILAAGVAHEINNPLAVLVTNLEAAEADLARLELEVAVGRPDLFENVREPIVAAREAAARVVEIAKDLRVFSRARGTSEELALEQIDVCDVLERSVRMAQTEIRHRARVVTRYPERAPLVLANESRLGQVFLNLLINAAQAIPVGSVHDNVIAICVAEENGRLRVDVRDTGSGIAPEHLPRLFEPFFTTKAIGVGTGLGLPICQRIVSEFGGTVEVESRLGEGTVFTVRLPLADGVVAPKATPSPTARPPRARVLVLDDELALARGVRRLLAADHEVELLSSGLEALARVEAGARFDVILCDLMMPQMTGIEFYAELTRVAPEQTGAVIFCTGGAFTEGSAAFLAECGRPSLDKPFDRRALLDVMVEVLGAAEP